MPSASPERDRTEVQPRAGQFPGSASRSWRGGGSECGWQPLPIMGGCFVLPVCLPPTPRGARSLLRQPGGSPVGTFVLAGAWFDDAWGCGTAYGDGGERDVRGREHETAARRRSLPPRLPAEVRGTANGGWQTPTPWAPMEAAHGSQGCSCLCYVSVGN